MTYQRWGSRFTNADGDTLDMSNPGVIDVRGRTGDFASLPYDIQIDESPTGAEAGAAGVKYDRGMLTIPVGLRAPSGGYLRALVDQIKAIMRPEIDVDVPNRGWLYIDRLRQIATPETWRIAVVPMPFTIDISDSRDAEDRYVTELRYKALSRAWELDPITSDRAVISPVGAWTTFTASINPGGDMATFPTFEVDGPASGTIATVRLENVTTGKIFELNNLSLAVNQRLIVTTSFLGKAAKIYATSGGVTGALLSNPYWRRTQASEFFTLKPGNQSIRVTKDGSSTSAVQLSYRRRSYGII